MPSARFEPTNLGTKGQHATPRPPKPITCSYLTVYGLFRDRSSILSYEAHNSHLLNTDPQQKIPSIQAITIHIFKIRRNNHRHNDNEICDA